VQAFELLGGLDIETVHADFQRTAHVVASLADAGEYDALRLSACRQHAFQLAARNDVETCAEPGQHVEYAQIRIRLDGEADQVRHASEGIGIGAVLGLDMGP